MKVHLLHLGAILPLLMIVSCESGPRPPQPGSPAFFWGSAQQTFKSGDLLKTGQDLQEILATDNEFTLKARVFSIVLSAGIAKGARDLAASYETGIKLNRDNPAMLRRRLTQIRAQAGHSALELAQQVQLLLAKEKTPQIAIDFPPPPGSDAEPPALKRLESGMVMPDVDAAGLQTAMLQRGVIQAFSLLVGSPGDSAKALQMLQTTPVQAPRETFMFGTAKLLNDEAAVFTRNQLDQPLRLKAMYDQALAALGQVPETKDSKALNTAIQAAMKKLVPTS
jgi:hypothetical protein